MVHSLRSSHYYHWGAHCRWPDGEGKQRQDGPVRLIAVTLTNDPAHACTALLLMPPQPRHTWPHWQEYPAPASPSVQLLRPLAAVSLRHKQKT